MITDNCTTSEERYHTFNGDLTFVTCWRWFYHKTKMCTCIKSRRVLIITEWPVSPILWLVYRLSAAVVVSMIFGFNFLGHLLLYLDILNTLRFFIYLTNWGLAILVICFIFKARLTMQYFSTLEDSEEFFSVSDKLTWAWVLTNISYNCAFGVTIGYWVLVYDGRRVTVPNMNAHIFNSVVTVLDILLVASPMNFAHFYQPILFGFVYLGFTFVYYEVGGTDHDGNSAIYEILNWDDPWKTVLIGVVGGSLFVIGTHTLICVITWARHRVHEACFQ